MGISCENRQRAKILSSPTQREERRMLAVANQEEMRQHRIEQFQRQERIYDMNTQCENKLYQSFRSSFLLTYDPTSVMDVEISTRTCFEQIKMLITRSHFTKRQGVDSKHIPVNEQLKAFIQARDKPHMRGRTLTFSISLSGLNKDALIDKAVELLSMPVCRRMLRNPVVGLDENQ